MNFAEKPGTGCGAHFAGLCNWALPATSLLIQCPLQAYPTLSSKELTSRGQQQNFSEDSTIFRDELDQWPFINQAPSSHPTEETDDQNSH